MNSKYNIQLGDKFGRWEVISLDSKPGYVKCKCVCGTIRDVPKNVLARGISTSCGCKSRENFGKNYRQKAYDLKWKKAQEKVGTIINGFKVLSVEKKVCRGKNRTFCKVICPACGKESEARLSRLPYIHTCINCHRNTGEFLADMQSVFITDGSSLISVRSRMKGTVNKNSSTKVNGVSLQKNGKYRAYINFRRKQYQLGTYSSLDDAAAARKEAESKIYGEYINSHEGWEDELKNIGKKYKKSHPKV